MKIGTNLFGIEIRFTSDGRLQCQFWRWVNQDSVSVADKQRLQLNGRTSRSRPIVGGLFQRTTVYETEERFKQRKG